jgi:hypothetical protein
MFCFNHVRLPGILPFKDQGCQSLDLRRKMQNCLKMMHIRSSPWIKGAQVISQ